MAWAVCIDFCDAAREGQDLVVLPLIIIYVYIRVYVRARGKNLSKKQKTDIFLEKGLTFSSLYIRIATLRALSGNILQIFLKNFEKSVDK